MAAAPAAPKPIDAATPSPEQLTQRLQQVSGRLKGILKRAPAVAAAKPAEDCMRDIRRVCSALRDFAIDYDPHRVHTMQQRQRELRLVTTLANAASSSLVTAGDTTAAGIEEQLARLAHLEGAGDPSTLPRRARTVADGVREVATGLKTGLVRPARELDHSARLLRDIDHKLAEAHQESSRDSLTQVLGREAFHRCLQQLAIESPLITGYWCLALVDLNALESVNKRLGTHVGDALLFRVAGLLQEAAAAHAGSLVGRTGGKQFAILLSRSALRAGRSIAEQVRRTIEQAKWECKVGQPGAIVATTVSVGLTEYRDGEPLDALLRRAECCLEEAKLAGPNTLVARS